MNSATDLARMVPGFDFLQGLLKNASAGLPSMGQWIAPTLDPAELEKRIQELKTVHFWLEQNARLLATTIQAMEVQRMTLATLHGMNVPLADLTEALKIKLPDGLMPKAVAPTADADEDEDQDEPAAGPASVNPARRAAAAAAAAPAAAPAVVDPLQWWGALTQQFTELAAQAVKDGPADAARSLADAMVKGTMDTASSALKMATGAPAGAAAQGAAKRARQPAGKSTAPRAAKTGARKSAATPAARARKR